MPSIENHMLVGRTMPQVDYERLEIAEIDGWVWQLHENQSYLGRLIIRMTRPELGSLAQCSIDEWLALHRNIGQYEKFMRAIFTPTRFNYGQLGNEFPQLHVHAVPRYAEAREWRGHTFTDERWGKNWAPTPASKLSLEETYALASWLRQRI